MPYKTVTLKGCTIAGLISDGFSEIADLASECQEAGDNFNNDSHPKAEAFHDAASTLEGASEPDIPAELELLLERECSCSVLQNKDKRRGDSRAVRLDNARGKLECAVEEIRSVADDLDAICDMLQLEGDRDDLKQALEDLADEVEQAKDEVDGVEFPGLYG